MVEILTIIFGCISSVCVAYFGYKSVKSEKHTADILKAQEDAKLANDRLWELEKETWSNQLEEIEGHMKEISGKVSGFDKRVAEMEKSNADLARGVSNVVKISSLNFELSQIKSRAIYSIGAALSSSGTVNAEELNATLAKSKLEEDSVISELCKIIY